MSSGGPTAGESAGPEPQRYVGYLIRRAQQRHVALWGRIVSAETTSVQYSILVVLFQRGEASQRELCDAVDLDRSTVADLVARMERRGLVARRRAPSDARRNMVTLTDQGRDELRHLRPRVEAVQRELVAPLDAAEEAALRRALERMLAG